MAGAHEVAAAFLSLCVWGGGVTRMVRTLLALEAHVEVAAPVGEREVPRGAVAGAHQVGSVHSQRYLVVGVARVRLAHFAVEEVLFVLQQASIHYNPISDDLGIVRSDTNPHSIG